MSVTLVQEREPDHDEHWHLIAQLVLEEHGGVESDAAETDGSDGEDGKQDQRILSRLRL